MTLGTATDHGKFGAGAPPSFPSIFAPLPDDVIGLVIWSISPRFCKLSKFANPRTFRCCKLSNRERQSKSERLSFLDNKRTTQPLDSDFRSSLILRTLSFIWPRPPRLLNQLLLATWARWRATRHWVWFTCTTVRYRTRASQIPVAATVPIGMMISRTWV